MKKRNVSKWLLTGILIFMFSCIWTVQAQAGTYRTVTYQKVKVGAYRVWKDFNGGLFYEKVSTGKKVSYNGNYSAITDGVYLYYGKSDYKSDRLYIYRHKMGTNASNKKFVCSIKHGDEIVGAYRYEIFVNVHNSSGATGHDETYIHTAAYNKSTKKLRTIMTGFASRESYGKYIWGQPNSGYPGIPLPLKVYNAATKKTKLLTKNAGTNVQKIGNYIYFTKRIKKIDPANNVWQSKVYKYKLGSTKNTLVSKKTFNIQYVESMTSSYIKYMNANGQIVTSKY